MRTWHPGAGAGARPASQRRDDHRTGEFLLRLRQVLAHGDGRHAELTLKLLSPLGHKTGRSDHQDLVGETTKPQLGQGQPGLDGLAEADLIGQDRPAAHSPQRGAGRLHLVVEGLEPQRRQRQESLETGLAPHPDRVVDQTRDLRTHERPFAQAG